MIADLGSLSGPKAWKKVVVKTAGALALMTSVLACGVGGETGSSSPRSSGGDGKDGDNSAATKPEASGEDENNTCAPSISGLIPAAIEAVKVRCPTGYEARDVSKALPVAGRFTTADELVKAYCMKATIGSTPPKLTLQPDGIDFEANDVVAFAYDAKAGAPTLYRRGSGEELWLQTISDTCTGSAPSLASVAFIVPKHADVNEQNCTRSCQ
jgi:hypothetical protein